MRYRSPFFFYSQEGELKSWHALAEAQFTHDYWERQAIGAPVLTPEEEFPALWQKAYSLGCACRSPFRFNDFTEQDLHNKLLLLHEAINAVFQDAPFAVEYLLNVPPQTTSESTPISLPTRPTQETEPSVNNPSAPTTARSQQSLPFVSMAAAEALTGAVTTDAEVLIEHKEKRRDVAYEVAQALLGKVTLKILGEVIYCYTGRYFQHITAENLRRLIMAVSRKAIESEGNSRLVGEVYKLLLCEPKISKRPEKLSSSYVSFSNGVLDLENGNLLTHSPAFNTYCEVRGSYKPGLGRHPVFDSFLNSITMGDVVLCQRIFEIIGYCLVPDLSGKVFFVFQGVPDSGKSVLAAFIRECLNEEAAVAMDVLSLSERFSASALIGRQLCTSMDLPSSPLNSKAVSIFKMITGGDPLTCDIKYAPHVTFFNTAKFVFGSNHPILTQSNDYAFYKRAVVVPFRNSISKEQQDPKLLEKLNNERDAILYDAIQAYFRLRCNKYVFSGSFRLNDLFETSLMTSLTPSVDTLVQDFIQQRCQFVEGHALFVSDLYDAFCADYGTGILLLPQFSALFLSMCEKLGAQNVRRLPKKREESGGNPKARIEGVLLLSQPFPSKAKQ